MLGHDVILHAVRKSTRETMAIVRESIREKAGRKGKRQISSAYMSSRL